MQSYPEKQYLLIRRKRRSRALKSATIGIVSVILLSIVLGRAEGIDAGMNFVFIFVTFMFIVSVLSFGLMFHYLKPSKEEKKYKAGVAGEKQFMRLLERYPGYKFYSLKLSHGGDIDALLISRKGVFAFEVKNYSGIIRCVEDEWGRIKIGKGGGRYEGYVGNPSEEAVRHANDLQGYLHRMGIPVEVLPVVVISDKKAELHVDNCSAVVLRADKLNTLLMGRDVLSKEICLSIKRVVEKLLRG